MTSQQAKILRRMVDEDAHITGTRVFPFPHQYVVDTKNPMHKITLTEGAVITLVEKGWVHPMISDGIGDVLVFRITERGLEALNAVKEQRRTRGAG